MFGVIFISYSFGIFLGFCWGRLVERHTKEQQ